jgi:predicted ATPase
MITNIEIKNFKSLKHVNLELRNLNILTGLNGSGKSSLIQTLLLLRQSKSVIDKGQLYLKLPESSIFEHFVAGVALDVYYQYGIEKEIIFNLNLSNNKNFEWTFPCDILQIPNSTILNSSKNHTLKQLAACNIFTSNFQYFKAERAGARNSYPTLPDLNDFNLGFLGEYAIHFLHLFGVKYEIKNEKLKHPKAKSDKLIHQTEAWLSEITGEIRLETEEISNEEVNIFFQFEIELGRTNKFKPKNVGFGISYVLPIIISLLTAENEKIIIIENPESHIHPRGQAELGKLISLSAQCGNQLIIETHSDHILNGIRIACKQKLIKQENAISYYFKRNFKDNHSEITPIIIDEKGKLWKKTNEGLTAQIPKGFFNEWTDSMAKLL